MTNHRDPERRVTATEVRTSGWRIIELSALDARFVDRWLELDRWLEHLERGRMYAYLRTEINNPLTEKVQALLAEFSRDNPPPWIRIRKLIETGLSAAGAAELLDIFGLDPNDVTEGSTPLRPEITENDDSMGAETDDGLGMGEAESWFRDQTRRDGV